MLVGCMPHFLSLPHFLAKTTYFSSSSQSTQARMKARRAFEERDGLQPVSRNIIANRLGAHIQRISNIRSCHKRPKELLVLSSHQFGRNLVDFQQDICPFVTWGFMQRRTHDAKLRQNCGHCPAIDLPVLRKIRRRCISVIICGWSNHHIAFDLCSNDNKSGWNKSQISK